MLVSPATLRTARHQTAPKTPPSVREYSTRTGYLLVEHAYPEDSVHSPRAYIDVSLVLESAKSELKHDGMWLNVLGYVRRNASTGPHRGSSEPLLPLVQALLIWDAGALDVKSYERVLQQQMDVRVHSRGILQKAHKALDRKA